ncbi:MAG TPA: DNA polymerase domain-containing protein, partial [Firmicutes bacterium]|nr:DNA polymerase domain-containing protein [Bacillota bacterium]
MGKKKTPVVVEGRHLLLSNLDKLYWPDDGYTKGQLVAYYADNFSYLASYLRDRPLVVTRYPNGITEKFFYQKNVPAGAPDWITTFPVPTESEKRVINYIICNDLPTLIWLVNSGAIELHPWLSRITSLDYPDFAVFDLDPDPPSGLEEAKKVALTLRALLLPLGLDLRVKTSGATGLHVYVPLKGTDTYEQVREFCGIVARVVAQNLPSLVTVERKISERQGKVYIDWLQNIRGQTICAPYSVRPLSGQRRKLFPS